MCFCKQTLVRSASEAEAFSALNWLKIMLEMSATRVASTAAMDRGTEVPRKATSRGRVTNYSDAVVPRIRLLACRIALLVASRPAFGRRAPTDHSETRGAYGMGRSM